MGVTAEEVAAVLGGRKVLGRSVRTMRDLERIIQAGVTRDALDAVLSRLVSAQAGGDVTVQLRHKIVPRATYQRAGRFNLQVSETTERLARLYAIALSVFGTPGVAARFFMTAHPELGERTPFDVALTEVGGRQVEEIIERGLHGLPA